MSYSQPTGYRMPASTSLPSLSRAMQRFGWTTWRGEAVRATGQVAAELLASPDDRESVLRRLSNDQVGEADLVISRTHGVGVLLRAAEFLDLAHAAMAKPTAVPLPRSLDLRCRAQFLDDPGDPERSWTYILFGTEQISIEKIFEQINGIQHYPIPPVDGVSTAEIAPDPADADLRERAATWERVLAPYTRSAPLSLAAPDPNLAFALIESLMAGDRDEELAAEGKVTASAVVADVASRLDSQDPDQVRARLLDPISD